MDEKKIKELLAGVVANLPDELKAKAAACKDNRELIELLGKLNVALPDELLEGAAGGFVLSSLDPFSKTSTPKPTGGAGGSNPFSPNGGASKIF